LAVAEFYAPGTIGPISEAMLRFVERVVGGLPSTSPDLEALYERESVPSEAPVGIELWLATANGAALIAVGLLMIPVSAVVPPHNALVGFVVTFLLAMPVTGNLLHSVRWFIAKRMVANQWRAWHRGERDLPDKVLSSDRDFIWQAAASLVIAALFAIAG
jgi:hypothetical protein